MTSSPLDSTDGWERRAWHDITAIGQHTRSNDVGRGITSPPLDITHGRTTSSVACHHHLCASHTVERHWAWHDITALGLHARSDDVGCGMTSPPLDRTHGRQRRAWHDITALGQHTRSDDARRSMPLPPFDCTHDRTTSGVAWHHSPWTAHTVRQRRAWHDITTLG